MQFPIVYLAGDVVRPLAIMLSGQTFIFNTTNKNCTFSRKRRPPHTMPSHYFLLKSSGSVPKLCTPQATYSYLNLLLNELWPET